jgi:MerR family transcriptional regulator, light-induced transcriptional regulator
LRFLEREGLLEPYRTEGGHRKFRASDIERVRTIKEWQSQHLSLEDIRQRLSVMDRMPPPDQLRDRFLNVALAGRVEEAASTILNMDDAGYPLIRTFRDVLTPALVRLGEGWANGSITVGQEHEVSELTRDLIADLSVRHAAPGREGFSVVAACVQGEMHELGLRMVSGLLRQRGVRVHFLGANVPIPFLVESVLMRKPDAVLLSITLDEHRPSLDRSIEALRDSVPSQVQPVTVVGRQFIDSPVDPESPGDVRLLEGRDLDDVINEICRLPHRS